MLAPAKSQGPQSIAQGAPSQEDADRKRAMNEAWKAYRGEFPDALKVEAGQPNDNVKSNRCAPVVDKGVSFLFGKTLKIEPTHGSANEKQALDAFWGNEDTKMTTLTKIAMNGGVCGQAFVKLIPPKDDMTTPRMVNLDPQLLRMVTDPEDCDSILAFIIEYPTAGDYQKRQVIARIDPSRTLEVWGENDPDDSWTITNYSRRGQIGTWTQIGEPELWPYPFAPVLTCQNLPNPNEPWGVSDLTYDLINQNKELNFLLSNLSRIVKYHGHPKTWAAGLRAEEISVAIEDVLCLPNPDSKLAKLDAMTDFTGILKFMADLRSDMDEQSRVPSVALGRLEALPRGNISGVALALLFQPLMEKTVLKQRLYGQLICDLSRAALVLAGTIPVAAWQDYEVTIHWQNLLPVDDLAAAQTAILLNQLGVSQDTILQTLGFDPSDEAKKTAKEEAKKAAQAPQIAPPMPQPGQAQQDGQQPQGGQQ